jgi:uncharacterized protein (TIGR02145 family)
MKENLNWEIQEGSQCYDNTISNCVKYGRLYKWESAMAACPNGWHLPSDEEWKTLEVFLGMSQSQANETGYRGNDEGKKLKSLNFWYNNGNGNNSSGFNGLPGGVCRQSGNCYHIEENGHWWSSTTLSNNYTGAWQRDLWYGTDQVHRGGQYKTRFYSVRCIKD